MKEAVFQGKFKQGEHLTEMQVAKWLNVSQSTVREALVMLEQNGLVVRHKNRKTEVNKLTDDDLRDHISMWVALEPLAAVRAAERMNVEDFVILQSISASIPTPIKGEKSNGALSRLEFHRYIWEKTGSPILARTLEQLTTPVFAFVEPETDLTLLHAELLEAMRIEDNTFIKRLVRTHIEDAYRSYLKPVFKPQLVASA